mmetsp:Transcript_86126/g.184513  ORF Transcript_86126/g.184513 Transcript_86126/m.184513 type:complete len:222 (+) Transcript_86126:1118-1783(+)
MCPLLLHLADFPRIMVLLLLRLHLHTLPSLYIHILLRIGTATPGRQRCQAHTRKRRRTLLFILHLPVVCALLPHLDNFPRILFLLLLRLPLHILPFLHIHLLLHIGTATPRRQRCRAHARKRRRTLLFRLLLHILELRSSTCTRPGNTGLRRRRCSWNWRKRMLFLWQGQPSSILISICRYIQGCSSIGIKAGGCRGEALHGHVIDVRRGGAEPGRWPKHG